MAFFGFCGRAGASALADAAIGATDGFGWEVVGEIEETVGSLVATICGAAGDVGAFTEVGVGGAVTMLGIPFAEILGGDVFAAAGTVFTAFARPRTGLGCDQ